MLELCMYIHIELNNYVLLKRPLVISSPASEENGSPYCCLSSIVCFLYLFPRLIFMRKSIRTHRWCLGLELTMIMSVMWLVIVFTDPLHARMRSYLFYFSCKESAEWTSWVVVGSWGKVKWPWGWSILQEWWSSILTDDKFIGMAVLPRAPELYRSCKGKGLFSLPWLVFISSDPAGMLMGTPACWSMAMRAFGICCICKCGICANQRMDERSIPLLAESICTQVKTG